MPKYENLAFQRHPLLTILSVIDEDPHEDEYESLDECDIQRRQSVSVGLKQKWKFGIVIALLSGIFFTVTSIMIQYFQVNATELLLVRSIFQVSKM